MARAGLLDHRKFKRLIHLLAEPVPHCVGYLECLWTVAYQARSAYIGDVLDVELAAQFPGERGKFCTALEESGFIDKLPDGKYEVHDLADHAPQHVRRAIQKRTADDPSAANNQPLASQKLASGLQENREERREEKSPPTPPKGGIAGEVENTAKPPNGKNHFPGAGYFTELLPVAERIAEAYKEAVRSGHSPHGGANAVVEILATERATEAQLLDAVRCFGKHAQKTYPDPTKRLSARNFFGGENPAWPSWVNGSPIAEDPEKTPAAILQRQNDRYQVPATIGTLPEINGRKGAAHG